MATETKTVTLRLSPETAEFIESRGESITQGVNNIIGKLKEMERYADLSLKGKFLPSEWSAIADVLNGTIFEGQFRYMADALVAEMEDAQTYDKVCDKWSIGLAAICAKFQSLSSIQVEALHRRVEKFWSNPDADLDTWSQF